MKVVKEHLDFSIRWKGDRVGIVEMKTFQIILRVFQTLNQLEHN